MISKSMNMEYKGKKRVAGKTEKEMYEKLGLQYIEPELRENLGEIDAIKNNELPGLLKLSDIKGDLLIYTFLIFQPWKNVSFIVSRK
jgi:hypothetical protein